VDVRTATFAQLDTRTLYAVLRLRAEVFVVEQHCRYLDPDGLDTLPSTRHCWIPDGQGVAAYLRLLAGDGGPARIGRVVTAPAARGRGYARALVAHALTLTDPPVVLAAQSHLVGWYAAFGFVPEGPEFDDAGVPHTPLRLDRRA
jgi:ElaA protein